MKRTFLLFAAVALLAACGPQNPDNNPVYLDDPDTPGTPLTPDKSDSYGIKALDLGLSVEWASRNLGALNDNDAGEYYAWGETIAKTEFRWENYKYGTSADNITKYGGATDTRLLPADDAATAKLGGKWRLPTTEEWKELKDKCKWTWISENNVYGAQGTVGDVTIFLPAGGGIVGKSKQDYGMHGFYWTCQRLDDDPSLAWAYWVREMNLTSYDFPRGRYGFMIRAVRDK
ncbi:MAG: hypothetical protein J5737_05645 [Bacteroidales bacterium]|nr:hypothetical protein [Bacteroidales bacterium]